MLGSEALPRSAAPGRKTVGRKGQVDDRPWKRSRLRLPDERKSCHRPPTQPSAFGSARGIGCGAGYAQRPRSSDQSVGPPARRRRIAKAWECTSSAMTRSWLHSEATDERDRRPPHPRRVQLGEIVVTKDLMAMLGQPLIKRALRHQTPAHHPSLQQRTLRINPSQHTPSQFGPPRKWGTPADFMPGRLGGSGRSGVDDSDELVVELGAGRVGVAGGVVALPAEDFDELDVGLVEPASLADGLEATVELKRAGTVTMARSRRGVPAVSLWVDDRGAVSASTAWVA